MTHRFRARMPATPIRQKHAAAGRSDNYGFLRSLEGNQGADVNLTWIWNDPAKHTEESGGLAFGLHWPDPDRNGYEHIMSGRRCRPMTAAERRRTAWSVDDVRRWRRTSSPRSERPRTQWELYTYVRRHGGTIIGELKSLEFAVYPWTMVQLVDKARDCDHAPWFKALAQMREADDKCANTRAAGGSFALAFGESVKGRPARLAAARRVTAGWKVKPTAVW